MAAYCLTHSVLLKIIIVHLFITNVCHCSILSIYVDRILRNYAEIFKLTLHTRQNGKQIIAATSTV